MQDRGQGLVNRLSATILVAVLPLLLTNLLLLSLTQREVGESARLLLRNHALEASYLVREWRYDQVTILDLLKTALLELDGLPDIDALLWRSLAVLTEWDGVGYLPDGDWSRAIWVMRPPLVPPSRPSLLAPDGRLWLLQPGMVAMLGTLLREGGRADRLVALIQEGSAARLLGNVGASRDARGRPFDQATYLVEDYQDRLLISSPLLPGRQKSRQGTVWRTERAEYAMRVLVPGTLLKLTWAEPIQQLETPSSASLPPAHLLEMMALLGAVLWLRHRARNFMMPLAELEDVTRRFGEGELGARVPQPPPDEFGDLGRAFNAMANQIVGARRELERAVQERTRDLFRTNQDLEEARARQEVLNRDLRTTVDDLMRLDRQRSEFLDAVSHDLRIPLTAIQGQAELLEEQYLGPLVEAQREAVAQLKEAVQSVTRMLDGLLEFARFERGGGELNRLTFPVREWLRATLMPLKILADRQCQLMSMDIDPDLDEMTADPDRLQSVMNNLVSNAVKFTPHGGRIQVRVRCVDSRIRFEVEDTGMGIPLEEQGKLFRRFYRARGSEHIKGVGLGLAVARGIIEMHGGQIGVVSEPGKGSLFWFEIPRSPETQ
ncbi:MAG: HAMP domain-containing sensor histidine kinase [bacterium]|nr:HAMP domain-containing sensor histidine kinase [bacterium]